MIPAVFELSFVESAGPMQKAGLPRLLCRLHAAHLPDTHIDDGKIAVVVRDGETGSWREYSRQVTGKQSREVIKRLEGLGMPGRSPNVEGVEDTSDAWSHIVLWHRMEQQSLALEIDMHSSGFAGRDAEQMRELFRYLFGLAEFQAYSPVIYGKESITAGMRQ